MSIQTNTPSFAGTYKVRTGNNFVSALIQKEFRSSFKDNPAYSCEKGKSGFFKLITPEDQWVDSDKKLMFEMLDRVAQKNAQSKQLIERIKRNIKRAFGKKPADTTEIPLTKK